MKTYKVFLYILFACLIVAFEWTFYNFSDYFAYLHLLNALSMYFLIKGKIRECLLFGISGNIIRDLLVFNLFPIFAFSFLSAIYVVYTISNKWVAKFSFIGFCFVGILFFILNKFLISFLSFIFERISITHSFNNPYFWIDLLTFFLLYAIFAVHSFYRVKVLSVT